MSGTSLLQSVQENIIARNAGDSTRAVPDFRAGDTVKVHARIIEGTKERVQVFEGVVIKRSKSSSHSNATFTVRKVSYNVGVERTFLVHSPRVEKIEVVRHGQVRRSRLFYLRPLRGKAARIKTKYMGGLEAASSTAVESSTDSDA